MVDLAAFTGACFKTGVEGNASQVRILLQGAEAKEPSFLSSSHGQLIKRMLALTASIHGNLGVARYMTETHGVRVHSTNDDARIEALLEALGVESQQAYLTPLHGAIEGNHAGVAAYLLSQPITPEELDRLDAGVTALHAAAGAGMASLVERLLELGASLDVENKDGHKAVCIAVESGHVDVARLLLEAHRSNGDSLEEVLRRPCSVRGDDEECIVKTSLIGHAMFTSFETTAAAGALLELLISFGPAGILLEPASWPLLPDSRSHTALLPIHMAALAFNMEATRWLVSPTGGNVPVDMPTPETGHTALHTGSACDPPSEKVPKWEERQLSFVRFLVAELGANKHVCDHEGQTAADLAKIQGYMEVYDYLTREERESAAQAAEAALLAELEAEEERARAQAAKPSKNSKKKKKKERRSSNDATTSSSTTTDSSSATPTTTSPAAGGATSSTDITTTSSSTTSTATAPSSFAAAMGRLSLASPASSLSSSSLSPLLPPVAPARRRQPEPEEEKDEAKCVFWQQRRQAQQEQQRTAPAPPTPPLQVPSEAKEEGQLPPPPQQHEYSKGNRQPPAEEQEEEDFEAALARRIEAATPERFMCPVSLALMRDPVVASDGRTYERRTLQAHIDYAQQQGKELRSPLTNEPMAPFFLPAIDVKLMIRDFVEAQRAELLKEREKKATARGGKKG